MLIICPTVDYELFFGRNLLSAEEVLFEPTRKLLSVWSDYEIRGTLFPDICSVWRHRELEKHGYCDTFEAQIKEACAMGHDVQLHLHPEWRLAEYRNGALVFKTRTHALHDWGFSPDDPEGAPALIRKGKRYLEDLLFPVRSGYRCIAFRAGGWIIQPEEQLVSTLLAEDIRVDVTVIPGMRSLRTDYRIDFRNVPDQPMWFISPQTGIGADSGRAEDLLEISTASYKGRFPLWQHALNQIRLRARARNTDEKARGYPITKSAPKEGLFGRLRNKYRKLMVPRVLDAADTHESMLTTLKSCLRHYNYETGDIAVCMNGHSKDTYDYHLAELRRFFDIVRNRYGGIVKFETISGFVSRRYPDLNSGERTE